MDQDPYLKIHIVEVYVHDQDKSLAFYRDRLGFQTVVDTGPQEFGRWLAVAPPVYESAVLGFIEAPATK
jgi:catechol 2,3-dioxygenase-like lactoylglutathione lyase family enzyme